MNQVSRKMVKEECAGEIEGERALIRPMIDTERQRGRERAKGREREQT